jgi:hypothetical protein
MPSTSGPESGRVPAVDHSVRRLRRLLGVLLRPHLRPSHPYPTPPQASTSWLPTAGRDTVYRLLFHSNQQGESCIFRPRSCPACVDGLWASARRAATGNGSTSGCPDTFSTYSGCPRAPMVPFFFLLPSATASMIKRGSYSYSYVSLGADIGCT